MCILGLKGLKAICAVLLEIFKCVFIRFLLGCL